MQETGGDV